MTASRAFLILANESVRERAIRWIRGLPVGTRIEFKAPRRSLDQNALLWTLLGDLSRQVEWYGTHLSSDDWKDVLTASLRKARVVPGIDPGTFVPLGLRTSDMTKAEFSDLLELIRAFGAERGVVFSDEADLSDNSKRAA
jgi:hypothetical protein